MQDKRLITIIGNVGVGKTTSLPLVAKALDAEIVRADEFFQVNPFRDNFLKDTSRWGFTNELYLVHKRITLIKNAIRESRKETIVIDSGLLMSWVYAKSHYLSGKMTLDEWLFFEDIFREWSSFALHTTLLYLTATPEVLLQRIKKRHRDYEIAIYSQDYIQQLEIGLRDLCANFAQHVEKNVSIDTTMLNLVSSKKDITYFMQEIKKQITCQSPQ